VTFASVPQLGETRGDMWLICPTTEAEYFCNRDWTPQISLIRLGKLALWRNGPERHLRAQDALLSVSGLTHSVARLPTIRQRSLSSARQRFPTPTLPFLYSMQR
jgi:hypothetical protein